MRSKLLALLLALFTINGLHAALVTNISDVGTDVVWTTTGSADLTALTFFVNTNADPFNFAIIGMYVTGNGGNVDIYTGITTSGGAFGAAGALADSGTGPLAGIFNSDLQLSVPTGYISGAPLASPSTATYANTSIAAMGLTPGSYVWSWGVGPTFDTLTVNVGVGVIPEPSTYIALTGFGALGVFLLRRRKSKAANAAQ